jgi:hypothetical protein
MSRAEHLARLLAELSPVEVFYVYDGPRFYSCRDIVGQLYIVYWIEDGDERSSWLYLRISPDRYASLKQGGITVASALSNPEEGHAFVVHATRSGVSIDDLKTAQIDPVWLPPSDERLSLETNTLPERIAPAAKAAKSNNRHVFDLAFRKVSNAYEMSCGKLGRLLDSVQNTIFALACPPDQDIRRVPEDVRFNSEVFVTGLFASSFGVRLQSKSADLFPNDKSERALLLFNDLIGALSSPEALSIDLHRLNVLSRSRFKHLLRMMVDAEISVATEWGSPLGANRQSRASFSEISSALRRLEATDEATTQIIKRSGKLVGVDIQSNFFALVLENKELIKGTLASAVATRRFEIPSQISATLQESCVIDPLTDREKWSYVLLLAEDETD